LFNCSNTSQHIHISFNIDDNNIQPDIYIILAIVFICHHFQNDIFKLFLITRSDNSFCKKLNFNINDYADFTDNYNDNLKLIMKMFFNDNDRYYWLNLVNLYSIDKYPNYIRPYTIEFRIKHGSSDPNELYNVSKLYENIINYAILLSSFIQKTNNIISFHQAISNHIILNNPDYIFHNIILKDIDYYFTDPSSDYVKGLNNLNSILTTSSIYGGKSKIKSSKSLSDIIHKFHNKPIFKINSFGFQFIGYGLDSFIIEKIIDNFKDNIKITSNDVKKYLQSYNIYI